jgi:hypothetical protein
LTDREKVIQWLQSIGATADEIAEVLGLCKACKQARAYFVARHDGGDVSVLDVVCSC